MKCAALLPVSTKLVTPSRARRFTSSGSGLGANTDVSVVHLAPDSGVEREKVLARALKCHPRVLAFPGGMSDLQTGHDRSLQRP